MTLPKPANSGALPARPLAALLLDKRLCRGEPRDGHAEWRGADVIHPRAIAEFNALGIASVLAANADLELRTRRPASLDGPFDHHAHAREIERLKRIRGENSRFLLVQIFRQKA